MYKFRSHITIISCILFYTACGDNDHLPNLSTDGPPYTVGEIILPDHEAYDMEFDNICYPADSSESIFSFSKHTGKVFMIEMSATW